MFCSALEILGISVLSTTHSLPIAFFGAHTKFYNATTQNNRKIDTVHNHKLYIASVSIKHQAVDHIKTAFQFWFSASIIAAMKREIMTSITCMTSVAAIVMEPYVNKQTDEKR